MPAITTYAEAAAYLEGARNRSNGRPLANNTRLEPRHDGSIAVRLHRTDVVTFLADGRVVLNTGGWTTVTTQDRINRFSPARVYSQTVRNPDGSIVKDWSGRAAKAWAVCSASPAFVTPPKAQRCRCCKGTGVDVWTVDGGWVYELGHEEDWEHRIGWYPYQVPERHERPCYRCGGTGERDYGSIPIYPEFRDGIVVDATGEVVIGAEAAA